MAADTETTSPELPNDWTATLAMICTLVSLVPIILILVFASNRIDELQGWLPILPAAFTIFLSIIGIGAATMSLDGKLTLRVGVGCTIGYFFGVMSLAGAVMIFLPIQSHTPWGWFIVGPAALLGVLSLPLINFLRRRRAARRAA